MKTTALFPLDQLVELYYQPLFHFAVTLYGRPETALVSTQRAFRRVNRSQFLPESLHQARQWLFTALFSDFLRARRRYEHLRLSPAA